MGKVLFGPPHSYFSRKYWHYKFAYQRRRKAWLHRIEVELARLYAKATTPEQFKAIANWAELLDIELRKET